MDISFEGMDIQIHLLRTTASPIDDVQESFQLKLSFKVKIFGNVQGGR